MQITTRIQTICTAALLVAMLVSQSHAQPVVGAYYYPWYDPANGGHDANTSVRGRTLPRQTPSLGSYNSFDPATISAHIDQSHRGNIDFWAMSWWGPNTNTDRAIRGAILPHARASELDYAIHYELPGRLGDFSNPDYSNLIPDFRYLADNFFNDPNYLRIDDRPVVFMYLARGYFNGAFSKTVVSRLRSVIKNEYGFDPYIVGDDVGAGGASLDRAQLWDAITEYDVYGTALQANGSTSAGLSHLASIYDDAIDMLAGTNVAFIPGASPGFNDNVIRNIHPAAPRYLTDDGDSQPGDVFEQMLKDVVVPRVDPRANNLLMINSFNEWHEDTQIEPTIVTNATRDDDSGSRYFTDGYAYEGYGARYLDILRETTLPAELTPEGLSLDPYHVDSASYLHAIYRDILHRPADGGGLTYWVNSLQTGTTREDATRSFLLSPERLGPAVDQYYQSLLGRASDSGGRDYWVNQLAGSLSEVDLMAAFAGSAEFHGKHPTDADMINTLYQTVLRRPADASGSNYYVSQLQSGVSLEDVIQTLLGSRERSAREIDGMYWTLLGRPADPTGLESFLNFLASDDAATTTDVMLRILDSDEFNERAMRQLDSSQWVYWDNVSRDFAAIPRPVPLSSQPLSAMSVPEPHSLALALVSVVILLTGRCRRGLPRLTR